MKIQNYDRERANRLLPLLRSIVFEIRERTSAAARLNREIERLTSPDLAPFERRSHRETIQELRQELTRHENALRRVLHELEDLGCTIDPVDPLTIRIPGCTNRPHHAYTWRAGAPDVELAPIEVGERAA